MKKFVKGMMFLSIGVLLAGCSCKKGEDGAPVQIEDVYDVNKVYDDVADNISALYEESKKSVVRVVVPIDSSSSLIGSGVVYKQEGNYAYIVTNAHVFFDNNMQDYSNNVEIVFSNYVRVKGTTIKYDRNEDVAVISVPVSDNYTVAKIASNDTNVDIGESVYSIGNPHGNYFSVTTGVISSNRIKTSTSYISGHDSNTYVFNSTATINQGNSGGAMFNSAGEVIAINTMFPNDTSDAKYRDFNYAIPINHFLKVADHLVTNRTSYVRSHLDLTVTGLCQLPVAELQSLGVTVKKGLYVISSNETDVAKGRIITHVNGVEVATLLDYEFELLKYSKNDIVTLTTTDIVNATTRTVNLKMK